MNSRSKHKAKLIRLKLIPGNEHVGEERTPAECLGFPGPTPGGRGHARAAGSGRPRWLPGRAPSRGEGGVWACGQGAGIGDPGAPRRPTWSRQTPTEASREAAKHRDLGRRALREAPAGSGDRTDQGGGKPGTRRKAASTHKAQPLSTDGRGRGTTGGWREVAGPPAPPATGGGEALRADGQTSQLPGHQRA